ncbi:DHH family phosphoesterase [Helcococcus bovis]|uniref:Cyclic-di-AMP phosphodiesterase n=2 Tax=Helcococcus bovis TaxID=3153252 RepID=A0ABW9F5F2_9FIRM
MSNNFFDKKYFNIWINPILVLVITIILLILNIYLGIIGIFASFIAIGVAYDTYNKKDKEIKNYIDQLEVSFEGFTKSAIFTMPFPIAILNDNHELVWYNSRFKDLIGQKSSLIQMKMYNIIPEINVEKLNSRNFYSMDIVYGFRNYNVQFNYTNHDGNSPMTLLYFIDTTDKENTLKKYEDQKIVLMNIRLDNYEELSQNTSSEKRPIIFAEIDSKITSYFHKYGSYIKKNDNSKYTAVVHNKEYNEMAQEKFSFVEDVRNVSTGASMAPTLSIGIGKNEESPRAIEKSANSALDIALGRGGDQIVIKSKDKLEYFGGKNQATEKRTKVKARVVAHALMQLIDKSTDIYISGHKNPDMDSFGSALGLWHVATKRNKIAYIVLSEITPAIRNLYDYAVEEIEGLREHIIVPDEAFEKIKESSLVIVTDNHRKASIEEPRMLEKTKSVVIIDHHRRGSDYIDNAILNYIEPYASSASELVTEMLMYMDEKIEIDKTIANALFAGVVVDTKSFNQQTGVRTFEAAVVLKDNGADLGIVNKLMSEDLQILKYRSEIILNSEIYKDIYIFGEFNHDYEESTLIASQAADEMMSIGNIKASFVFTISKGRIHISARSYGDVSVQLIMEKLNGGGHRTMAATQIDSTIEEAKELLKKAISEYEQEED